MIILHIVVAAAIAAFSSVAVGYFANDPAKGITTGFSQGELQIIPFVVFILVFFSMRKSGRPQNKTETKNMTENTEE